jgi:hypothetical protein
MEGHEAAFHSMHYGMRVVAVGKDGGYVATRQKKKFI